LLKVKDTRQVVELKFDAPPPLSTGTELNIEGYASETRFHVTSYAPLERSLDSVAVIASPLTDGTVKKARTVGVIAVDSGEVGLAISSEVLRRLVLDADNPGPTLGLGPLDKSARQYYSENSYGQYRVRGAMEGPVRWDGSACIGGSEDPAVVLREELSTTYDSYIWYFDSVDEKCGYAWGEEGTWSNPAQNTWFNGRYDANVFSHEMGHNVGLMHASTISCDNTPLSDEPLNCTTDEYGSRYSVMGTGGIQHLNGVEKWYLTWFAGCNGVHVKQSGTFTLLPLELPCNGIQVLQVPMPNQNRTFFTDQSEGPTLAKYYYLELRTNQKLDTGMTPQVMVHISDDIHPPTEVCARTALLDMNPSTPVFDGLLAGEGYTDPTGDLTVRVDNVDNNKAMVTITMTENGNASTCIDGALLIGPGPDSCDEAFSPSGAGGVYGGNVVRSNVSNAYTYDGPDGAVTSNTSPTSNNSSTGDVETDDLTRTTTPTELESASGCGCQLNRSYTTGFSTLAWTTLSASLVLTSRRRRISRSKRR
jgi:hypothetical protein